MGFLAKNKTVQQKTGQAIASTARNEEFQKKAGHGIAVGGKKAFGLGKTGAVKGFGALKDHAAGRGAGGAGAAGAEAMEGQ